MIARTGKPTLDQRRAAHAWETVESAVAKAGSLDREDDRKAYRRDYGRETKKLPMRIMAASLGHALAFVKEKNKAPDLLTAVDDWVLTAVGDWVLDKLGNPNSTAPRPGDDTLIKVIIEQDAAFLRRATEETLAYLLWLNRFAAVELREDDDDE